MQNNVTENTQLPNPFESCVTDLIRIRNDAKFSQDFISKQLNVCRKKLNEFENGKFDFDLFLKYCDLFSIELKVNHFIH